MTDEPSPTSPLETTAGTAKPFEIAGTASPLQTTAGAISSTAATAPALPLRGSASGRVAQFRAIARSARTRILVWQVVLLVIAAVLAVVAIREVLVIRLDAQVQNALEQEMRELDRLLTGIDPQTGQPFASLESLFNVYLSRNVPSSDEAMLAFVEGELYRSAVARFPLDRLPAETLAGWEARASDLPTDAQAAIGRFETDIGPGFFRLARISIGDQSGAFVVAILPAEELQDIAELQAFGVVGASGLLLLASVAAWVITGRVLAPVRSLTETAESISRSDLTRRIEVEGAGEAADMARSFNAMLDRLEGVFRSQREFVQDTSHELRDPLTICRASLELLPEDPEERAATVALITDELDRMARIVNDLQVLADSEHPDFVRAERIDLEPFSHELVAKASALATREWKLDQAAEGVLEADRWGLTEAVMNLANNAVAHTEPTDTIAVGTAVEGETLRLWVRDTGSGIALADQARIFDRFQRGSGAQRRYRGSGLGLAIVKAIAEAHGGRVELVSRIGIGSTFTLVVPMHRAPAA